MENSYFKTLIVGVDFSKTSRAAVRMARKLSEKWKSQVIFAHVAFLPPQSSSVPTDVKTELIEGLEKRVASFYKVTANEQVKILSSLNHPGDELAKFARKKKDPLLMVGNAGHNLIARLAMGSTAERLALHSGVPVWIQRGGHFKHLTRALVPYDFSKRGSELLKWAKKFGKAQRLKLDGVYVSKPVPPVLDYQAWMALEDSIMETEAKRFKKLKAKEKNVKFKIQVGDPADKIVDLSKHEDLVIMAPHNSGGWLDSFGSVSAKVVRRSHCPVIVLPNHI